MIRIKNILCPLDFSPASMKAFDYSLKLAARHRAGVFALHVISPFVPGVYDFPVNISEYIKALQTEARRQMARLARKAEKMGVRLRSEVIVGGIDYEISKTLTRTGADILVMGSHGRRGFERWFLGSETERMIRKSPVPVLTMAAPKHLPALLPAVRKILVATDFSEGTGDAVKYAFSLAKDSRAGITFLHVVDPAPIVEAPEMEGSVRAGIEARLKKLVPAGASARNAVKTRVEVGQPNRVILEILKDEKPDLVVLNVHGKGMIDRALLGSTAERVVRGALCPVLLVPAAAKRTRPRRKRVNAA